MLVEENIITPQQLEDALELQEQRGEKLGKILIDQGMATPQDLAAIYSVQLNIPLIDLKRHVVQPEALRLVPESMARQHTLIPLDVIGDSLLVAMSDPEDFRTVDDIRTQIKMRVEVALALPDDIKEAIDLNYRSSGELEERIGEFAPQAAEESEATSDLIARTPVAKSLDLLVTQAVRDRASDVHLEPQEHRLRIRYRIDGVLREVSSLPLQAHAALISRIKILAEMNISERRRSQDGQFSMKVGDRDIDIRAASMETDHGERVTLRILDKSMSLFGLPELGLSPDALSKCQAMLKSPFGMILVGGPTGSGKTTTLYAMINQLDRNERNIMTIEDPVEYGFTDISQTQVNPKAGITFTSGLRAILRHDPDAILVGEIRDKDTAETAVQAALTGHLVFSSTHANDAIGALVRLSDLGVEPYLVASTLIGVISQRMVRRVCSHCAVPSVPQADEQQVFLEEEMPPPTSLIRGAGCNLCGGTGYRGRVGLFEILIMSSDIRRMLLDTASGTSMKAQALKEGMVTIRRDGLLKAGDGVTTVSEIMRSVFSLG